MSHLRVVVVEDQAPAREHLASLLAAHADVEVVAVCADGGAAIQAIPDSRADVVLLDIQMPEYSGFDVIDKVGPDRMPPVIFITAYEDHAVRAFEVRALDYIVKPFSHARVDQAIERVRAHARQRRIIEVAANLACVMSGPDASPSRARLPLRRRDGTAFVLPEEIECVRASRNDVVLCTHDGEHRVRATLAEIRQQLGERFVQVHRSTLVNIDRVRPVLLNAYGVARLRLLSGREVRVSAQFRRGIEDRLRVAP
jgi:two-component system LytT family response regulator